MTKCVAAILSLTAFIHLLCVNCFFRRSAWIDEATLLVNFQAFEYTDILKPLKYYDQAEPPLVTLILGVFSHFVRLNIINSRFIIYTIISFSTVYLVFIIYKYLGKPTAVIYSLLLGLNMKYVYYATEIKHYGIEIAGVQLMLAWYIIYNNESESSFNSKVMTLLLLGLFLGFSTLLPFCVILGTVVFRAIITKNYRVTAIIILLFAGIVHYIQLKYYSVFQLSNYFDVYEKGNKYTTVENLHAVTNEIFSPLMIYLLCFLVLIWFLSSRLVAPDKYITLTVITIAIVVTGKFAGLYPIYTGRQIVWLIPMVCMSISSEISAILSVKFFKDSIFEKILTLTVISVLMTYAFIEVKKMICFQETIQNSYLYQKLAAMNAQKVLVWYGAQPSLDLYTNEIPQLTKHEYLGVLSKKSGKSMDKGYFYNNFDSVAQSREGVWGSMTYLRSSDDYKLYIDWLVSKVPHNENFIVLLSHFNSKKKESLVSALQYKGCELKSVVAGRRVELISAMCR